MNMTVTEAAAFFKSFRIKKNDKVELLFCSPYVDLPMARFFLENSSIRWGAQNVYPEEKGAFTGEISPAMLKDLGCSYVICGHSERRQILGESDEFVARKVKAVLAAGMVPILCVGETAEERKLGQTEERIGSEIRTALFELSEEDAARLVIAYEQSGPLDPAPQPLRRTRKTFLPSSGKRSKLWPAKKRQKRSVSSMAAP